MVNKVLTSKLYGKLTDTYAYNVLDQLTSYTGYDGYRQQLTYDANGMRLSKSEAGNGERSTLEELLRGEIAGLPEIVQPVNGQVNKDAKGANNAEQVPAELEWATTEYLYDITQEYYQVVQETQKSKSKTSTTTAYAYGLERIAAYGVDASNQASKTRYVYDGRGSVAQSIALPVPGENANSALVKASASVAVQSFRYTAFGEQMGAKKVTGWGYNAEGFDAATGMINLRMRQYEASLNRFTKNDDLRGSVLFAISQNNYLYAINNPPNYTDPSGMTTEEEEVSIFDIFPNNTRTVSSDSQNQGLDFDTIRAIGEGYYAAASSRENQGNFDPDLQEYMKQNFPGFVIQENLYEQTAIVHKYVNWLIDARAGYGSNCAALVSTGSAGGGLMALKDIAEAVNYDKTIKFGSIKPDGSTRGVDTVSSAVAMLENDDSFIRKIEVTNLKELDTLMSSEDSRFISACVMTARTSSRKHIVIHKRTVVYGDRTIGTFIGASNNRNDIPYDYALQENTLTFILNKGYSDKTLSSPSATQVLRNMSSRIPTFVLKVANAVISEIMTAGSIADRRKPNNAPKDFSISRTKKQLPVFLTTGRRNQSAGFTSTAHSIIQQKR